MGSNWTRADLEKVLDRIKKPVSTTTIEPSLPTKAVKRNKYGNQKVGSNDSKSENAFAIQLRTAGIEFTEKDSFEIQSKFEYLGENIRPICMEPDFIIRKNGKMVAIVDTKHITGYTKTKTGKTPIVGTADWRMKVKMLKLHLKNNPVPMFFPVTKAEKVEVIFQLLDLLKSA
jgi:hypothetical protein